MTRIKVLFSSLVSIFTLAPAFAFAAAGDVPLTSFGAFLQSLKGLMNMVVPILIGLAVIVFLFGVLKFIFNAGDEGKRTDGKWMMIYGIIGIVVMVSVWGLVSFVQTTFGLQDNSPVPGPVLQQ